MSDLEKRVEVLERKDRSDELWARYGIVSELLVDANRRIEVLEGIVKNTIPELQSRIHVLEMQAAAKQAENKPPTITPAQVEEVVRDYENWVRSNLTNTPRGLMELPTIDQLSREYLDHRRGGGR